MGMGEVIMYGRRMQACGLVRVSGGGARGGCMQARGRRAKVHVGECARGEWRGRAQESGESGEAGVCEGEGIRSALGEGVEDGEKGDTGERGRLRDEAERLQEARRQEDESGCYHVDYKSCVGAQHSCGQGCSSEHAPLEAAPTVAHSCVSNHRVPEHPSTHKFA